MEQKYPLEISKSKILLESRKKMKIDPQELAMIQEEVDSLIAAQIAF